MRTMPRLSGLMLVALGVAAVGCARKPAAEDAPAAVAEVTTVVLAAGELDRTVTAFGAAEFAAGGEATLSAPMEATVARVDVGAGAAVRQGQTMLALLPSAQSRADLAKATADAAQAAAALARAERLRATGLDSNADVETARAAAVTADASLRGLRARQSGLAVRSPVTGLVESVSVGPRDLIAAGATLAKVGRASDLKVRLGLDPAKAAAVRLGAAVRLQPLGGEGGVIDGVVSLVDRRLDPQTHMAGVVVSAPPSRLAPGEALRAEIVLGHARGPLVPRRAILWDGDKPYVLVVAGGKVHRKDIAVAAETSDQVVIGQGAAVGDRIVVEGGASLDDGAAVREAPGTNTAGKDAP